MDDVTFQKAVLNELREINADLKAIRAALEKRNDTAQVTQSSAPSLTVPTPPFSETPRKRK